MLGRKGVEDYVIALVITVIVIAVIVFFFAAGGKQVLLGGMDKLPGIGG